MAAQGLASLWLQPEGTQHRRRDSLPEWCLLGSVGVVVFLGEALTKSVVACGIFYGA